MPAKTRNQEQSQRTREALVRAGRALFAAQGFQGTGTEEIVARAEVTRGALYHHYADKAALFLEVFEAVERDLIGRLAERVAGVADPTEMLQTAAAAFLDLCQEQEVRQIALVDAPSVLGWEGWREVEARYGLALIRGMLERAADAGHLDRADIAEVAHLVLGAATEAALFVAHHPDEPAVRARMERTLTWMLTRVIAPPGG